MVLPSLHLTQHFDSTLFTFPSNHKFHLRQIDPGQAAHSQRSLLRTLDNNHNLRKLLRNPYQTVQSQRSLLGAPDNAMVTYAEVNQTAHRIYLQAFICSFLFTSLDMKLAILEFALKSKKINYH